MVNIASSKYLIMCNNGGAYRHRRSTHGKHFASKHSEKKKKHFCMFKVFQCSSQQLCLFCFLLYYFAAQANAQAPNSTYNFNSTTAEPQFQSSTSNQENKTNYNLTTVTESSTISTTTTETVPEATTLDSLPGLIKCDDDACFVKISSSKQALTKMIAASGYLFDLYSTANGSQTFIDNDLLDDFIYNIGHMEDDHAGHDHESHEGHDHDHHGDSHEGHDHEHHDDEGDGLDEEDFEALNFIFFGDSYDSDYTDDEEVQCYTSVKELVRAYFRPADDVQLTLGDFISLMPQILLDMQRPQCGKGEDGNEDENGRKPKIEHNLTNVWLISFGSVLIISLVSLLGVLMIPLLKHSKVLNHLIAFLVALAVGTLTGDALLHLLPHASGTHGHTDHDHSSEQGDDHFDSMWKGLVACAGVYAFFLLETIMGFIHRRKHSHKKHSHGHKCKAESPSSSSPSKQALKVTQAEGTVLTSPCESPLLTVPKSMQNGKASDGDPDSLAQSLTPLVTLNGHACQHAARDEKPHEHRMVMEMDEEPLDTGHHHHHSHEVPQTVASLAWMVIVGDGLHNVTDGLAIGAAFTSSIGAGLSTVLAIFFHEIPQELGDFAVLLNAGMSVKQALLWNFISACMCFVGLVVGLLVGEYTSGIILWILAFTAGGFLYIALVDMLPAMMRQLGQKDYMKRFIIQNIGMLTGYTMMVIIALKEDTFASYF